MKSFLNKIRSRWSVSSLCVGLDPDLEKIPVHLGKSLQSIYDFNCAIIDATHDLVCAYKPQIAYYAALGAEAQLKMTIEYIHQRYPDVPVILDSKRGDIGDTAEMYAREAFVRYEADAVTVNPYMGGETLTPFTNYKEKGVIVLCRTSNPGSGELQALNVGSHPLYLEVARRAVESWNANKNILLVVGGTQLSELKKIRQIVGDDMVFLVPGVGAQGADPKEIVKAGANSKGQGLIVNSSRAILYASVGIDFASAARKEALRCVESLKVI